MPTRETSKHKQTLGFSQIVVFSCFFLLFTLFSDTSLCLWLLPQKRRIRMSRRRREGTRGRESKSFVFNLNVEKNARGKQERTAGQWRIQRAFQQQTLDCNILCLLASTQTHRLLKLLLRWNWADSQWERERWIPFQLWSDRQSNHSCAKTQTDMNQDTQTLPHTQIFTTAMWTHLLHTCTAQTRTWTVMRKRSTLVKMYIMAALNSSNSRKSCKNQKKKRKNLQFGSVINLQLFWNVAKFAVNDECRKAVSVRLALQPDFLTSSSGANVIDNSLCLFWAPIELVWRPCLTELQILQRKSPKISSLIWKTASIGKVTRSHFKAVTGSDMWNMLSSTFCWKKSWSAPSWVCNSAKIRCCWNSGVSVYNNSVFCIGMGLEAAAQEASALLKTAMIFMICTFMISM